MSRFAYRKLQQAIITKAIEYNVLIISVDPKNISITCPRCSCKLDYNHSLALCKNWGFISDRDIVGVMNMYLKALQTIAPYPGLWGIHSMTD
ncbi:MAG: transposase [Staphylothermus sp.]|nr:transposase [Staphylothermus sp.]